MSDLVANPATGLRVPRRFTVAGTDPFESFTFVEREAIVRDFKTGEIKFQLRVEVPDDWEQGAVDVLASKYCRKAGVPQGDEQLIPELGPERSARQVVSRMADAWKLWGQRGGYFASDEDADAFRDEIAYMIMNQMGAPNSPQWFNTGLFEAYGIVEDPDGNSYYDAELGRVVTSAHKYERSSANACFILSVKDELVGPGSIMNLIEREARLFKGGSGAGSNVSAVRGRNEKLTGGGTSSGVMSFLRPIDRAAGAIKSGGTTRRAAKMVILNLDHPEIDDFIWCKVEQEKVVAALIAAGYDSGWDTPGGAYDRAEFQNANHSVRIPSGFLKKLIADGDIELVGRKDGAVLERRKARELWDAIAEAAWICADPGVQFDGLINDWATTPNDGRINGSNPCSEYLHIDDTACNLASLNLAKFFDADNQVFDTEAFEHATRIWTIALEITVAMSHYPSEEIAFNSYEHRTLGLGFANLGALLMRAGLPYDSREGRAVMGAVTALMNSRAYATSAEMAAAVGPCAAYERNVEPMQRVLRNHRRAAYGSERARHDLGDYESLEVEPVDIDHRILARTVFSNMTEPVKAAADDMVAMVGRHGARNAQATVIAPTGTIGLVMSCDTTGPEPDFALVKWKKLAGGGMMKIVNHSVEPALRALGYDEATIVSIITHALGTTSLATASPINHQSLIEAGLDEATLAAVEVSLPTTPNLAMAFSAHIVGDDVFTAQGLDPATASGADLLTKLGFTVEQMVESSLAICGHETLEGAPGLRDEDLPVFDTANYCGDGSRVIAWRGHVEALGAIQPHVSGGISKTINMPNDATIDDVRDAHELAYQLGVKCVAVFRDGSKLSQPLNRNLDDAKAAEEETGALIARAEIVPGTSPESFYKDHQPPRFKLPHMRTGKTFAFNVGGMDLYVTTGEFDDGTLGELWINLAKDGSTLKGAFSQFAIALSLGLQRGVPLSQYVEKFTGQVFEPKGLVTGDPNLKMATSIPDAIFRLLGYWYLGRDDLVQAPDQARRLAAHKDVPAEPIQVATDVAAKPVPVAQPSPVAVHAAAAAVTTGGSVMAALESASPYTGDLCPNCQSPRMVRNGSCSRCLECGETTGCS